MPAAEYSDFCRMDYDLNTFLHSIYSFDDFAMQALNQSLKSVCFKRGESIYRKNIHQEHIFLIEKGLVRMYQIDEKSGAEINRAFFVEKDCVYACSDPDHGGDIQTLEDTHVYSIPLPQASALAKSQPGVHQYIQKVITDDWKKKETLLHMLMQPKAEDRYRVLEEKFHHLLLRVPLYHLASFLNITPVHLSRIRKTSGRIS